MSNNLKEIVQQSLRLKQVSPEIVKGVDVLIQRSILDLTRNDIIPSRMYRFTSLDKKQEYRDSDGKLVYNFYYLPEDFRKLDWFRPRVSYPYELTTNEYDLYQSSINNLSDDQVARLRKKFTITNVHQDDDSPFEKVLIAYPFPEDDETVEIKYYSNGKNQNWDWLDESHYEVIISWIYRELGLRSSQDVEEDLGRAVSQHREPNGNNIDNKAFLTLNGSYFGRRSHDKLTHRTNRRK